MTIPIPLNSTSYSNTSEIFDEAYNVFQFELNYRANRPLLLGRDIYIDTSREYEGKYSSFWHISSIGADHFNDIVYPCCNDISSGCCKYMCDVDHQENFLNTINSVPCIFRACRIKWVKYIIELANRGDQHIKIWRTKNSRTKKTDLLIRYIEGHIDYVIIFEIVHRNNDIGYYRFKTAYPVVFKSFKNRFDREYNRYISSS